jgi:hypothetical protein
MALETNIVFEGRAIDASKPLGAVAADQFIYGAGGVVDASGNSISGITTTTTASTAELNALHSQGCVAADFAKLHAWLPATAAPTLTSSQATTWANLAAAVVQYNQLQADVAALVAAVKTAKVLT